MTTYAIGDVQGCLAKLEELLARISFHPTKDTLWFTGDLINRGPQSLETLRFIKSLGDKHKVVLGNHDLHLIAVSYGARDMTASDTLNDILRAPDRHELIEWLCEKPLLHYDPVSQFVMTHAGLPPPWDLAKAISLANEISAILQGNDRITLLKTMYGTEPSLWNDTLEGADRARCIINYLTRMRYCHADGRLDLTYKGTLENKPAHLYPWFDVPNRADTQTNIIFGHWAALCGKADVLHVYPLDTGCVWGNALTAFCLESGERTYVACG